MVLFLAVRRELQDDRPGADQRRRHLDRQRVTATEVIDPDVLQGWLSDAIGQPIERVELELLPQGHANGAWRIVADIGTGPAESTRRMVLKAPRLPSIVHDLDPCREARVVDALGRAGAPVPAVVAIDPGTQAVGRPCFVMEWVDGRSVPDAWPNAYHDGWFLDAGADAQRATWDSFHDALAAVHRVDLDALVDRLRRTARRARRAGLLARRVARGHRPNRCVPRHLAVFDWLAANVPPSAEAPPALCMGDARLGERDRRRRRRRRAGRLRGRLRRQPDRRHRVQPLPRALARAHHAVARPAVRGRDVGALERGDRARARRPRLLDGVRRHRHRRHRDAGERDVGPTRLVLRGPPGPAPAVGVGRRGRPGERPTSTCIRSTPRCGRGTSRGTSRGSTSTAVPPGSSASDCSPTRSGRSSGRTCSTTASGTAPRRRDSATTTST